LLAGVSWKSRGQSVYVVGSHLAKGSFIAKELGQKLAEREQYVIVDGQSDGLSRDVITAFVEERVRKKCDITKYLKIFANPYAVNAAFANDPAEIPTLKTWRAPLLRATQVFVCFDGNIGTTAELEVAIESGCRVIPACTHDSQVAKVVFSNNDLLALLPAEYKDKLLAKSIDAADIAKCIDQMIQ